jgi:hypothetical protein
MCHMTLPERSPTEDAPLARGLSRSGRNFPPGRVNAAPSGCDLMERIFGTGTGDLSDGDADR